MPMRTFLDRRKLTEQLLEFHVLSEVEYHRHSDIGNRNFFQGQGKILLALEQKDNIPQKDLSNELNMTPQSITEFVNKLQKQGLLEKNKSESDGRISLIKLTDLGRVTLKKLDERTPSNINYLNDQEQHQLSFLLDKMIVGMHKEISNDKNYGSIFNNIRRHVAMHITKKLHEHENTKNHK